MAGQNVNKSWTLFQQSDSIVLFCLVCVCVCSVCFLLMFCLLSKKKQTKNYRIRYGKSVISSVASCRNDLLVIGTNVVHNNQLENIFLHLASQVCVLLTFVILLCVTKYLSTKLSGEPLGLVNSTNTRERNLMAMIGISIETLG